MRKATRTHSTKKSWSAHCGSRTIPPRTRLLLVAAAAGRCEFQGCNDYLFEHPLTLREGNFGNFAHNVAFSEKGPRGKGRRPPDLHDLANLLLMCLKCHKLVDDD